MRDAVSLDEMRATAASLGFTFSDEEAPLYVEELNLQLQVLEGFLQDETEVFRPPLEPARRRGGHRPLPGEDPLRAWLWRCHIVGAAGGLLEGKTVSFKDHIAVAGVPMSFGVRALETRLVPDFDATVVARALQTGATIVGKNAMNGPTGGYGFGGGIGDYERPLNPHSLAHLSGGSSSGSAVAVAAGQVDISFGGDQGGSIRIPAAWSGVVGLKPTFGLVSHFGVGFNSDQSMDSVGPIARRVEDVAAALEAVAGYDGLDPRQGRDVPERLDVLGRLDAGVEGVRIGMLREGFAGADNEVSALVQKAVDMLAQAGAEISWVSVPEHRSALTPAKALTPEGSRAAFDTGFFGAGAKTYYPAEIIAAINELLRDHADSLHPRVKLNYLLSEYTRRYHGGRVYAKAHNVRAGFVRAYDDALSEVDVLVMPTSLTTAPRYEPPATTSDAIEENFRRRSNPAHQNVLPFNYTGHPALAMPCGKSAGLPVSMQLIGRFFDDPLLLQAAHVYQHAVPYDAIIETPFSPRP